MFQGYTESEQAVKARWALMQKRARKARKRPTVTAKPGGSGHTPALAPGASETTTA